MRRLLTEDQKQARLNACHELKEQLEVDPNRFSEVITGDESWCPGYDSEMKQQSSQRWHSMSQRPQTVCRKEGQKLKSKVKDDALFHRYERSCAYSIYSS